MDKQTKVCSKFRHCAHARHTCTRISFAKFILAKIWTATVRYMSSAEIVISKNSNSRKIRPAKYKRRKIVRMIEQG